MKLGQGPGWDWNGVIGSGQSLSVGAPARGAGIPLSTEPRYQNLKLSLGGARVPPWDPEQPELAMVPLVEPIRPLATEYPSAYPANVYGETPHTAMATQITALAKARDPDADHVTVHTVVGECGQGMAELAKQTGSTTATNGRAYAAALFEAAAITRLARAAKKTYGVRAVLMTHGETDWESPTYKDDLVTLIADLSRDLGAITGQSEPIVMLLSQQFAFPTGAGERPLATNSQWLLGVERPGAFVCTGPRYQYAGEGDSLHLTPRSYAAIGEKSGQVYFERFLLGRSWRPLSPLSASVDGGAVTVRLHVPVPPLTWDDSLPAPRHFPRGRGFELFSDAGPIEIDHVEITSGAVRITPRGALPEHGVRVGYAMTSGGSAMQGASGSYRFGQLRDSDPFVGATTGLAQANYCVSFELPLA
jgi:hypothetical protein